MRRLILAAMVAVPLSCAIAQADPLLVGFQSFDNLSDGMPFLASPASFTTTLVSAGVLMPGDSAVLSIEATPQTTEVSAVPEPSTVVLLSLGPATLACWIRLNRKALPGNC